MRLLAMTFLGVMMAGGLAGAATPASQPARTVPFQTHEGYFVSNKFEPDATASFVIARSKQEFDKVFGAAFVMGDRSRRLPANAFDSRMVLAVIHRGKAMWTYTVKDVRAGHGVVTIEYNATARPHESATFACPLIVSIPKGDYAAVEFVEGGKLAKRMKAIGALIRPATAPATGPSAANDAFKVTCRKSEDRVNVALADGNAVLAITCPRGIGGATIERKADAWPKTVVLRLHLGGLESLAISCGDLNFSASVSSQSGSAGLARLWMGGKEGSPLAKGSPFWMEIRALDSSGKPVNGLPGKGGCFEMTIPKALLDKGKSVKVAWIDFYRG